MRFVIILHCLISFSLFSQIPHEHPDHPKGNSAAMYEALPFYNEACELYANGLIERAKRSLHEAINVSFELTEAQLFLADIYYDQGKTDSAFLYYNSGIDFNIEQKPHYYFKLFETGLRLGQYSYMKHNLSHFKKLYSSLGGDEPYEMGFAYKREDLEFYDAVLSMIYNYQYWKPTATLDFTLDESVEYISCQQDRPIVTSKDAVELLKSDFYCRQRSKKIKGIPNNAKDIYITSDGKYAVFSTLKKERTVLCFSIKNGRKYGSPTEFSERINTSKWQGTPFLSNDGNFLYFSSEVTGNKDLFVAKVDLETRKEDPPKALDRINTSKDEISPYFNPENQTFYFSSNGLVGFGGQDMFYCKHFEIIEGGVFPFDPQNAGATFNTHNDELFLRSLNTKIVLKRKYMDVTINYIFNPVQQKDIYFEITPNN